MKKKAIYVGGMLNVFFNIYGKRYDTTFFDSFINKEYQINPFENRYYNIPNDHFKSEGFNAYFGSDPKNKIISVALITTNLKKRLRVTINTIKSLMNCVNTEIIDEIVVSVDELDESKYETCTREYILEQLNANGVHDKIKIHFKKGTGMIPNQINAISKCVGDIIIYSEDDIVIKKLPSKKSIIELTDSGAIMYNHALCYPDQQNGYKHDNFISTNDEIFYRKEKNRYTTVLKDFYKGDNLSVTFPCAIMKKDTFINVYKLCHTTPYKFSNEGGFSYYFNSEPHLNSYIYCTDKTIPLSVLWNRNESERLRHDEPPIDRSVLGFDKVTDEDIKKL